MLSLSKHAKSLYATSEGKMVPAVEVIDEMAWVYILKCKDDSYYVGSTPDLERRVAEHQAGILCDYTSRRRPVELVFCQEMVTIDQAFHVERQLKGWSRRKKEAIIAGKYDLLPELSRSRQNKED